MKNTTISNLEITGQDKERIMFERAFARVKECFEMGLNWEQARNRCTSFDLAQVAFYFFQKEKEEKRFLEIELSDYELVN